MLLFYKNSETRKVAHSSDHFRQFYYLNKSLQTPHSKNGCVSKHLPKLEN